MLLFYEETASLLEPRLSCGNPTKLKVDPPCGELNGNILGTLRRERQRERIAEERRGEEEERRRRRDRH